MCVHSVLPSESEGSATSASSVSTEWTTSGKLTAREDLQLRQCPGRLALVEQSRAVGCTHQSRWCPRVFRTFHRMRDLQLQSHDRVGFWRWPVSRERRRKWHTHRTTAAPL